MPQPRQVLIRATDVRKSFSLGADNTTEILHGIDLEIADAEFVAIVGASGSGKSTLLYALSGIDLPTSGSVAIDGVDLATLEADELERFRLKHLGFVFQQPQLLDGCTLRENALLPALWRDPKSRAHAAEASNSRFEALGIAHVADNEVATASGGERQRAAIVRALVNEPRVLFADEPTGALDSTSAQAVLDILSELHRDGLTIVLITHDSEVAARADRIVRVVDGELASATAAPARR